MNNAEVRFRFDKRNKATMSNAKNPQTGKVHIEVREIGTNNCVLIQTGVNLFKDQVSGKGRNLKCVRHNNASGINGTLKVLFNRIEAYVLSDKCQSIKDAKDYDNPNPAESTSFIEFMKDILRKKDPSLATIEHHNVLIRKLEEFGKIKTFKDVTYENIYEFDIHLKKTINSLATLNKRHSALHQYIKEAINRDLMTKDPYFTFKKPPKKSKEPTFLTEHEINKIKKYKPVNERLERVKDLFIFQMFTGLAYVDLANFTKDKVVVINGMKVIQSERTKTGEQYIALLLKEAEYVADKYNYNLPMLSNQKYNDYLKLLGAGSGINKSLTSHVARHTYATYLINKGVSIESVSKSLGHSNIKMTQHYAKLLGESVINEINQKVNKKR